MPADAIAPLEPAEVDETRSVELGQLSKDAMLRARPVGDQQCSNCRYFLENTAELSYCWNPGLRVLVGADWWCQWWESEDS